MQRIIAILAFVGLLAGTGAVWPAQNCCSTPDCCKSGFCPMHAHHAKPAEQGEEVRCHGMQQAAQPTPECDGGRQCSQRTQAATIVPQPLGVLPAAPIVESPRGSRAHVAASEFEAVRGFVPLPFQPPRRSA